MFSVHITPGRSLKTRELPVILDLCFRKTLSEKLHDYCDANVFEKLRFQSAFRPHGKEKLAFSNSSGLKSVFENFFVTD